MHVRRAGRPLALVAARWEVDGTSVADLCDPRALTRLRAAPDMLASRRRDRTQPVARRVWDAGFAGLRWWSAFRGDWHTTVVFSARAMQALQFGEPEVLTPAHPAVVGAADALGIERG
jgi:hypothetical protein